MIIHCPNCSARYNLTPAQVGPQGRQVRCIKCKQEWFQDPISSEDASATPPIAPETSTAVKKSATDEAEKKKATQKMMMAAGGAGAFVIALGVAFFLLKDFILTDGAPGDSPGSVADAEYTGPAVTTTQTGLVLGEIQRNIIEDGELNILIFTGTVTNTNTVEVPVAPIRVSLLNEQGIELDSFPALPKKTSLTPGETIDWICRFYNPPLEKISEFRASFAKSRRQI